jgi:hypothetical protein
VREWPRHAAIEQRASRSADFFRSGTLDFELFNDGGFFRSCVPLRHEHESRVTEEVVVLVLLNRAGRMPALPEKEKI